MVLSSVNEVREYIRTDLSEEHVAMIGRCGCGVESQALDREGGVKGERMVSVLVMVEADEVDGGSWDVASEGKEVAIVLYARGR